MREGSDSYNFELNNSYQPGLKEKFLVENEKFTFYWKLRYFVDLSVIENKFMRRIIYLQFQDGDEIAVACFIPQLLI